MVLLWDGIPHLRENQHIYIISNEEIKMGDYYLCKLSMKALKCIGDEYFNNVDEKKIILTTDVDLISDGVQSISDEFLEWFVKNTSCENVELKDSKTVKEHIWDGSNDGEIIWEKEIIIPMDVHFFECFNIDRSNMITEIGKETIRDLEKIIHKWQKQQIEYEELAEIHKENDHNFKKFKYKGIATRDCWKELLNVIKNGK